MPDNKKQEKFIFEIHTYEKILNGELKTFSPYFFSPVYRKKRLINLIKYLIEEKLNMTPQDALKILNSKILKQYKLYSILKYIEKPVELDDSNVSYIIYYAYPELNPPTQKELTIYYYKKVLAKEKNSFPKNYFFDGLLGEDRAKYCVEYLCEEVLKLKKEEIPKLLTIDILREYKLKILLTTLYFSMFDLITNVYPNRYTKNDFK